MRLDDSARRLAVLDLARRYGWHEAHGRQVARLALDLFDQSRAMHALKAGDRELLEYGALLHDIGDHVSADDHHKHTAYLIEHSGLTDFAADEVAQLACLGRFHRRGDLKTSYAPYRGLDADRRDDIAALVALLRLADGLDRTRRGVVGSVVLESGKSSRLEVTADADPEVELWCVRRKADLFENVFGCRLAISAVGHEHLAAV